MRIARALIVLTGVLGVDGVALACAAALVEFAPQPQLITTDMTTRR